MKIELILGQTTDSARWDALTREIGGTYHWYGIAFGWVFVGIMVRRKEKA